MALMQMVETIWEGDVKDFSRAFELICIVDQIQHYAVNNHRPFVMNHLEAWHARHHNTLHSCDSEHSDIGDLGSNDISDNLYDVDEDSEMGYFDSDDRDISSDSYDVDKILELLDFGTNKPPEWLRLKEQSKIARNNMSNETRKRNQSLRVAQASKATKEPEKAREPEKTRPRRLPPRNRVAKKNVPKHGRGKLAKMASKAIPLY
jgi:hypothetical protein